MGGPASGRSLLAARWRAPAGAHGRAIAAGLETSREGPAGARPADMFPGSEEVCGESRVEGPKWPLLFGTGGAAPTPCAPGEATNPEKPRHPLAGPWAVWANSHLGNDRGRGKRPGSRLVCGPPAQQVYYWDPWKG